MSHCLKVRERCKREKKINGEKAESYENRASRIEIESACRDALSRWLSGEKKTSSRTLIWFFFHPALRSFSLLKGVDSVEAALVGFTCTLLCWLLIIPQLFRLIYPGLAVAEGVELCESLAWLYILAGFLCCHMSGWYFIVFRIWQNTLRLLTFYSFYF